MQQTIQDVPSFPNMGGAEISPGTLEARACRLKAVSLLPRDLGRQLGELIEQIRSDFNMYTNLVSNSDES
jgi:hypothetical protein